MSNIRKSESGLPINIFVSSGGSVNKRHGPRIKAMVSTSDQFDANNTVSIMLKQNITADDIIGYDKLPPKILIEIRDYINLNFETLMKYWNDEISTTEMVTALKKLNSENNDDNTSK